MELRCPVGPRHLFARMIQRGERPVYVHPDNLIEFSCYHCRHDLERRQGRRVRRVLHRYDIAGTLVETLVVGLGGLPVHAEYNPPEIDCVRLTRDHHLVYLRRVPPGGRYRTRILIGEVRRHVTDKMSARDTRCWRAFPEGVMEFPELFANRLLALEYLKRRWDFQSLMAQVGPPRPPAPHELPSFFGDDLWGAE